MHGLRKRVPYEKMLTQTGILAHVVQTQSVVAGLTSCLILLSIAACDEGPAARCEKGANLARADAAIQLPLSPESGQSMQATPLGTDCGRLLADLTEAGLKVEVLGEAQAPFASITGTEFKVNGGVITVYEYASEASAVSDAVTVSPDGYKIEKELGGGKRSVRLVEWIAAPHFHRLGKLLVLYVGDDRAVIDALQAALGPPFAGG